MSTANSLGTDVAPVGHQGARVDITQRNAGAVSGWLGVLSLAGCVLAAILLGRHSHGGWIWLPVVAFVLVLQSLVIVAPGQTRVIQFFGRYVGTVQRSGFWLVMPLTAHFRVSTRVRNFETNHLKVNDADGNPIEIAAIVVW
ncbi:MAG TPA: SPFH domain-containing protein, partial [Mycobacteriales bacterium]|nr:SPFH domain-containing protein [Mycobacteriales bacterium]